MKTIIFGVTQQRANAKFDEILTKMGIDSLDKMDRINPYFVNQIRVSVHEKSLELINGDYYLATVATEGCRGHKANRLFVDAFIDKRMLEEVILPTLIYPTIPDEQVIFWL